MSGLRIAAAPDWERPGDVLAVLSAYINVVRPDSESVLYLDAGAALPGALVGELAATACERLSQGRPFAEIVLHAPGDAPADCVAVSGRDALLATVGMSPPALASDAESIVAHARWAKAIVDELQHLIDRRRFEDTVPPPVTRDSLVSVRIPTYGDVTELMTRTLPSVLNGEWRNFEIVVCSDGPQPHARAAVESVTDPRVRYIELPARPAYPSQPYAFWRSGGIHAANAALDACRGDFVCPLDHDDAFTVDHIPRLLEAAARSGADFVYGQAMGELRTGPWYLCGVSPLTQDKIAHGAVMFSRRLAHVHQDELAWLGEEAGDWNLWRRMRDVGARIDFVPTPVLIHFKQRTSIESDPNATREDLHGDPALDLEWAARDLAATAGRVLLDVCAPAGRSVAV
jgi:hypothetical protein